MHYDYDRISSLVDDILMHKNSYAKKVEESRQKIIAQKEKEFFIGRIDALIGGIENLAHAIDRLADAFESEKSKEDYSFDGPAKEEAPQIMSLADLILQCQRHGSDPRSN